MDINNCEYCNVVFKTKSALNNHKNKAKYCLIIQKKIESKEEEEFKCAVCEKKLCTKQYLEIHSRKCGIKETKEKDIFKCEYCEKMLSSKQNLTNHLSVCLEKKDRELNELKDRIDSELKEQTEKELLELKELREFREKSNKEIFEKDKIIIKVNGQLENYKEQLEKQEEQIKDLQEKLDKIVNKAIDRPTTVVSNTTTNNNLNIMSSLDFNNTDRIKNAIENKLNVNHVVDGQKGLAKFMVDTILTDDDGNLLYVCTDSSRNIFKYKNSDGEINKDVEAKKLISFMVDAGIKVKSVDIARDWCKNGNENGNVDITRYGIMESPQEKIMKIEDDSCCFKRELASMTSK